MVNQMAGARKFVNPILSDKLYNFPSALKANDTYYVVARSVDTSKGIFPIHTSTDLVEWKSAGYIFDDSNAPKWANNTSFTASGLYQIGPNFLLYFSAENKNTKKRNIGVAVAPHPLGPYSSIDRQLVALANHSSSYPTIINDEGRLFLVWTNDLNEIKARQLNSHGLSFSSEQEFTLLKPTVDWEEGRVYHGYHARRGGYNYLFYNGCPEGHVGVAGVGVARSSNVLGPYEKISKNQIMKSNKEYGVPHDINVVKDLDNKNDIIFFKAYRMDGHANQWSVLLASLTWNADGWPSVGDY